jgi:SAM-dependent methyltransferase
MKKEAVKTWSTPVGPEESRPIPCAGCGGRDFRPALCCEGFTYVRCTRCGLRQINPQPLAKAVSNRYQAGFGEAYLRYELAHEAAFLRLQLLALEDAGFSELETKLKPGESPKVLDAGCATGALLAVLQSRGWETTGVEISPAADYARRERGLDVRSLPLEENKFPPGYFDLVLASHLIEHLNDPGGFVREACRICKPGAYLLITTPNIAGFQARLFGSRWRSAIFDHLYLFSVKTLSRLLRDRGFVPEKTITWGGLAAGTAPAPLKAAADRWAKRLGWGDVMLIRARKNPGA